MLAVVWTGCAAGETGSPTAVSASGATFGGRVVSDVGGQVEYWVQYGRTTAYGSETAHATLVAEKNVPRQVFGIAIEGLTQNTSYHYRLCARDSQQSGGPGCGVDRKFKTQAFACGETVTTSVRLTGNVICDDRFEPGLVIGADGIEINLAGHSLSTPIGAGGGGSAAVLNSGGYGDVTIRNGRLSGGEAVRLDGASRNRIIEIDAATTRDAILIQGGEANEVRTSTISGRLSGIAALGSDRLVAAGNHVSSSLDDGIRIESDLTRIVRNQVSREGHLAATGIEVAGSGNRLLDNRVTGPWDSGGIVLVSGAGNVIAENQVYDVGEPGPSPPSDRFGDGIFVGAVTVGTALRSNLAARNGGDGIEVDATAARVGDNSAVGNGDFGIDAAPGVTDLGGNRASGNGNPLQCRNVFCG